jgi:hypothetical protein
MALSAAAESSVQVMLAGLNECRSSRYSANVEGSGDMRKQLALGSLFIIEKILDYKIIVAHLCRFVHASIG